MCDHVFSPPPIPPCAIGFVLSVFPRMSFPSVQLPLLISEQWFLFRGDQPGVPGSPARINSTQSTVNLVTHLEIVNDYRVCI